ncbi:condensation domain-containing protein, partial [Neorhizobium sp. DT-125]|uniref:condensation domain-containing protein n=1 Tax=Neorhizobium sp. DT-125 TaxID=3396163 RepID=UPI003F1D7D07
VPRISFNYLGQFDQALERDGRFGFAEEEAGAPIDPHAVMAHLLDLNSLIMNGKLSIGWRYSPECVAENTVSALAETFKVKLEALISHCLTVEPVPTASDFVFSGLTQSQLEALALSGDVADIYPATQLQQGLLFHGMLSETAGHYINQMRMTLGGATDRAALRQAWQAAVDRHEALRTAFISSPSSALLQVVRRSVTLPCAEHDWSCDEGYEERLAVWLSEDVARGFDPAEAPLMRINLFARPDGDLDMIWTSHHALMDGWSTARLIGEIVTDYASRISGRSADLPQPGSYRDYAAWISRQASPQRWWQDRLKGFDMPPNLIDSFGPPTVREPGYHRDTRTLEEGLGRRLRRAAQRHQLTLNSLMQGAWALLLSRYTGYDRVVFGATVSGRPAELSGAETMVGLFINSLPVFVDVSAGALLGGWLRDLQQHYAELRQHEHTALTDLQRWAGRSGDALFDTLFVFENYPVDQALRSKDSALSIRAIDMQERNHYPLTLVIIPSARIEIGWSFDGEHIQRDLIERIAAHYVELLSQIASAGEGTRLGELTLTVPVKHPTPADYPFVVVTERIAGQAALAPETEA